MTFVDSKVLFGFSPPHCRAGVLPGARRPLLPNSNSNYFFQEKVGPTAAVRHSDKRSRFEPTKFILKSPRRFSKLVRSFERQPASCGVSFELSECLAACVLTIFSKKKWGRRPP